MYMNNDDPDPSTGSSPAMLLAPSENSSSTKITAKAALTLAALGVVFGDIGTSPLYAFRECFAAHRGLAVSSPNVLGAASLILWFLILIVSIKYVVFVMRADNKGEGGILSLMALVHRIGPQKLRQHALLPFLGILGAAMLFSDGVITPSISILSAIEGVSVAAPLLEHLIIPISLAVLTGLFLIQFHGTAKIGSLFGPVIILWFLVLGVLGLRSIISHPQIFAAFNPIYAILLIKTLGAKSLLLLGTAFLAVTGAEVLFADMGHFGKSPIRFSWFAFVFPALALNYLGQGAKLLELGHLPENLFYALAPGWFLVPLIVIATAATVIASQAVISGAFSLARQAVQLGFWPRIKVIHTSASNIGQVYLPFVNLSLYVVTFLLIAGFKESGNLASAYGIAVSATMLLTSVLILIIAKSLWKLSNWIIIPIGAFMLILDLSLFAANLSKFASGGWIVIVMAASVVIMMTTWITGRKLLQKKVLNESIKIDCFSLDLAQRTDCIRTPKTAVFLSGNAESVPRALLHNFKHTGTLHATNIILCVQTEEFPLVKFADKFAVTDFGSGIYRVIIRYGYMESPNIPRDIAKVSLPSLPLNDPLLFSYYLGKESLVLSRKVSMNVWRKQLFLFMARNSLDASSFFKLPPNRVVEMGVQIEF